jgi:membrane protease YdiL (CAAX protease family)
MVATHVLVNRVAPPRLHVPLGLGGALLVAALAHWDGASLNEQGLDPADAPRGLKLGALAALPVVGVMLTGLLFPRTRKLYWDEKITSGTHIDALYESAVRIPLGTALAEEIVYRGALPALLEKRHPRPLVVAVASALFGLSHITPTLHRLHTNPMTRKAGVLRQVGVTAGVIAATSAAGVALWFLRARSGSVLAPALAHAAANSVGYGGGWIAAKLDPAWRDEAPGAPEEEA